MKRYLLEDTKLQLYRMNESRDLVYSAMTLVNTAVVNPENLLRE